MTIGLGLINFNLLINSTLGSLVSEQAPRAIDAAFRIYMLPQGMFSVAIATVLFPALSRLAARRDLDGLRALTANGMRQIFLLLIPAAAATLALADPITRLIYEHGEFGADVDRARLERAVLVLLLPALQRRQPAAHAHVLQPPAPVDHDGDRRRSTSPSTSSSRVALYEPFGIAGIVVGTAASSAAMTLAQIHYLRRELHGRLEGRATLVAVARMAAAAAAAARRVAYGVWYVLDDALGRDLLGADRLGRSAGWPSARSSTRAAVRALRHPEARQIERSGRGGCAGVAERRDADDRRSGRRTRRRRDG